MTTWKRKAWLIFRWPLLGVAVLLGSLLLLLTLLWVTGPPSPDQLKQQFQSKRAALDVLVQLVNEDGRFVFCIEGAGRTEMQTRITPERFEQYRARLEETGVKCIRRDEEAIELTVWSAGFPGTDRAIGFAWSLAPFPNEFPCLQEQCFPPGYKQKRWEKVHERIAPDWALFAF